METLEESTYKVFVVGSSCVGKTSYIRRFAENAFDEEEPITESHKVYHGSVTINSGKVNFEIHDTISDKDIAKKNPLDFKSMDGAFILFNVFDRRSFEDAADFIKQVKELCRSNISILVVATMNDEEEENCQVLRKTRHDEGVHLAFKTDVQYSEVSSLKVINITQSYGMMAHQIRGKIVLEKLERSRINSGSENGHDNDEPTSDNDSGNAEEESTEEEDSQASQERNGRSNEENNGVDDKST